MYGPQGYAQGAGLPNVPEPTELWKNEKTRYRQWMILLIVGMLAILILYSVATSLNLADADAIKAKIIENGGEPISEQAANNNFLIYYMIIPFSIIAAIAVGIVLHISSMYESYKKQSFAYLSNWSITVIGVGAIFSAWGLISTLIYRSSSFDTPGQIFSFINQFIFISVYFIVARKVSIIRRAFIVSERVKVLKSDPRTKQMMEQGAPMGPFGPMGTAITPTGLNASIQKNQPESKPVELSPEVQKILNMSLEDLKVVAKKLSISGADEMKKKELQDLILKITADQ